MHICSFTLYLLGQYTDWLPSSLSSNCLHWPFVSMRIWHTVHCETEPLIPSHFLSTCRDSKQTGYRRLSSNCLYWPVFSVRTQHIVHCQTEPLIPSHSLCTCRDSKQTGVKKERTHAHYDYSRYAVGNGNGWQVKSLAQLQFHGLGPTPKASHSEVAGEVFSPATVPWTRTNAESQPW